MPDDQDSQERPGGVYRIWEPTPELRWTRPPEISTEPSVLEQLWRHPRSGREEWRPVPLVPADLDGQPIE